MIPKETKLSLFKSVLRIRRVEEAVALAYSEGGMRCPIHLSIGQEGVAAGVCEALEKTDYVLSTHRAHAHYLAKGGDLKRMFAELYGKSGGCCRGRGGSMHLIDLSVGMLGSTPIVGSSLPVAVGAAFGTWMKGAGEVTAVFFGEAATEGGSFAESINFAALKNLPVLFVCENNLYSVYSPMSVRQSEKRDRVAIAKAHGMITGEGDGNQAVEVWQKTKEALSRIREGEGPAYLEFETYRWREHCGPNFDNNSGYRTEEEFLTWQKKCPLDRAQKRFLSEGILTPETIGEMEAEIQKEIREAFAFAKESPFPKPEELESGVYAPAEI